MIPTLEETVERMKREILDDIGAGRVPTTITCFADLDDHRDANAYGGFCDDAVFDALLEHFGGRDEDEGKPAGMDKYIDDAQAAVDAWIRKVNAPQWRTETVGGALHAHLAGRPGHIVIDATKAGFVVYIMPEEGTTCAASASAIFDSLEKE